MNRTSFFLLLAIIGLFSCQSGTTTEQTTETVAAPNNFAEAPELLAGLFNPNAGVFRGLDFSMGMTTAMAQEKAGLVEQVGNSATYSIDFNEQEFADMAYETDGTVLKKMQVDIFAATPESAAQYHQILKEFFDQKYLPRTPEIWDGSENGTAFSAYLQLIDDPQAPGVLIVWERN
jgi:hypothetical protein